MNHEIRCPRCDKLQMKIGSPIKGMTEIEIKCYNNKCKTLMKVTLDENPPRVVIEDVTPNRRYPFPMRTK